MNRCPIHGNEIVSDGMFGDSYCPECKRIDSGQAEQINFNKKMTDRQKRNKEVIEYLQNYINSYPKQHCYLDYTDEIIIDDVLYGLGVALYGDECKFANGYDKFKQILMNHLTRNMVIVKNKS